MVVCGQYFMNLLSDLFGQKIFTNTSSKLLWYVNLWSGNDEVLRFERYPIELCRIFGRFPCKKAKVKPAKLQISYCNLAKCLLPTGKKAIIKKRLIVKLWAHIDNLWVWPTTPVGQTQHTSLKATES